MKKMKSIQVVDRYGRTVERDDGVLQDGDRVRMPMWAMDALQTEIRAATMTDATYLQDAVIQARAMAVADSQFAYRGGAKDGDLFQWKGMQLVVTKDISGELVCAPLTTMDAHAARLAANEASSNAWRRGPA
jgi:hypothetical protein